MPLITTLQMLGVAGVASYAAARLAAKAGVIGFNRCTLVAVPVSAMPEMPRGFRIEAIGLAQLANLTIDASPEEQARRFTQGMVCLAAYNRTGEFVGVNWLGTGPFDESMFHVRFEVPRAAAWDTGLWIAPEHRLGRAFAALWAGSADWLRQNGRDWSISWIADYNLLSILSHRRMQSRTVGHFTTLRCFRWQFLAQGRPRLIRTDGAPARLVVVLP